MTTHPGDPPLLRTAQAAAHLGVSKDTIRRWADAGKLPHVLTPTGQRRYRLTDIEAAYKPPGAA